MWTDPNFDYQRAVSDSVIGVGNSICFVFLTVNYY